MKSVKSILVGIVFGLAVGEIAIAGGPGSWQNNAEDCWGENRIQTYIDIYDDGTAGNIVVYDSSGDRQEVAMSGDATMSDAGVITVSGVSSISNAPTTTDGIGAINTTNVTSVVEQGNGVNHKSILTLAGTASAIADGAFEASQLLYTFPAGLIVIESIVYDVTLTMATTNFNVSTDDLYNVGFGTAINDDGDGTISAAGVAFLANQSIDTESGATQTNKVQTYLAAGAFFDGTTTPIKMYWNWAVPAANDNGANTNAPTGTITINWKNGGDY